MLPVGKQAGVRKLKSERQTQQSLALKKTSTAAVVQSRKSTSAPTKAKSKEVVLKQAKQQQPINTTAARPPQKTDLDESVGPSQSRCVEELMVFHLTDACDLHIHVFHPY